MFSTMQRKLYFYIHFGFLAIFHDFTVTLMPSQGGHFWRLTSLSLSSFPIEPLFFTTWWNERIPGHSEINEVQKSCVNVGLCCFHGNKNYFLGGLYYKKKKWHKGNILKHVVHNYPYTQLSSDSGMFNLSSVSPMTSPAPQPGLHFQKPATALPDRPANSATHTESSTFHVTTETQATTHPISPSVFLTCVCVYACAQRQKWWQMASF